MRQEIIERLRAKAERAISAHADLCKRVNDPKYPDWADDALELCAELERVNAAYGRDDDAANVQQWGESGWKMLTEVREALRVPRSAPAHVVHERTLMAIRAALSADGGNEVKAIVRDLAELVSQVSDHTPESFRNAIVRLGNRAIAANQAKGDAS